MVITYVEERDAQESHVFGEEQVDGTQEGVQRTVGCLVSTIGHSSFLGFVSMPCRMRFSHLKNKHIKEFEFEKYASITGESYRWKNQEQNQADSTDDQQYAVQDGASVVVDLLFALEQEEDEQVSKQETKNRRWHFQVALLKNVILNLI